MPKTLLALAAEKILARKPKTAAMEDASAEFQRVHSYIADCMKDSSVLYAKLARLQGDFRGEELNRLITISEEILALSSELQSFSREFSEGRFEAVENPNAGGFDYSGQGGAPAPAAPGGAPAPAPAPAPAAPPPPGDEHAAPPPPPEPQAFSTTPEPPKDEKPADDSDDDEEEETEDYSGEDDDAED